MKLTTLVLGTSLALVPALAAHSALANDAKKEALKKAKEAAVEKAKERSREKLENARAASAARSASASAAAASAATASDPAAAARERETHARNVGVLERLQQIATATNNSELKVIVIRLNGKEDRRHALATSLL